MKRFFFVCIAALVGTLLSLSPAEAGGCSVRRVVQVRSASTVVVKRSVVSVPVVKIAYLALGFDVFPQYGAGYYAPAGSYYYQPYSYAPRSAPKAKENGNSDPVLTQLKLISERLENMDNRIRKLEGNPPVTKSKPTPMEEPKETAKASISALGVLTNKCAACHESKVAATDGKGFVLFKGSELVKLDDSQSKKVMAKLWKGAMPPKDNKHKITSLTDEEVAAVVNFQLTGNDKVKE